MDASELAGYIGKELEIKYNERGADWERVGWFIESSQKIVLDGLLRKDGCIYLVGHDNCDAYLIASKCEVKEEDECGEFGEICDITEISANGSPTNLADLLRRLSKPHDGCTLIVEKKNAFPNCSNIFLSDDYLGGREMVRLLPQSTLPFERPLQ